MNLNANLQNHVLALLSSDYSVPAQALLAIDGADARKETRDEGSAD
jgi:hypothetical protein